MGRSKPLADACQQEKAEMARPEPSSPLGQERRSFVERSSKGGILRRW